MGRPHLMGMVPEELMQHLDGQGVRVSPSTVRRLLAHVVANGHDDLDIRGGLKQSTRSVLEDTTDRHSLELVDRAEDSSDGFVKYLFSSPDGALSEAVRIPLRRKGRYTVCLSSQVGCSMGCRFCATGRLAFERNLAAWEMISAFREVRRDVQAGEHLSGAVFQGQGEPFENYDEVIKAANVLSHPCGGRIRGEAISISTAGLVPQIRRYTKEMHRFRLIVSLTSAIEERRRRLMPVVGQTPLEELAAAVKDYAAAIGDRVTVAWVVIGGVNTGADEAAALEQLLGGVPLRLNLIDVNDPRPGGFRRATNAELQSFIDALQPLGVPIVRRYSGGVGCHAACGMLAARHSSR